jgi:hypothetical protein
VGEVEARILVASLARGPFDLCGCRTLAFRSPVPAPVCAAVRHARCELAIHLLEQGIADGLLETLGGSHGPRDARLSLAETADAAAQVAIGDAHVVLQQVSVS